MDGWMDGWVADAALLMMHVVVVVCGPLMPCLSSNGPSRDYCREGDARQGPGAVRELLQVGG